MFHWICPECGREIPPSIKECSVCDPSSIAAASVPVDPIPAPSIPAPSIPAASIVEVAPEPIRLPDALLRLTQKLRETPVQSKPVAPELFSREPYAIALSSAPKVLSLAPPAPEPADPAVAGAVPTSYLTPRAASPPPVPLPAPAQLPAAPLGANFAHPALSVGSSPAAPALALSRSQDSAFLAKGIRPAAAPAQILRPATEPRITLPGPALPHILKSLENAGLSRILADHPKIIPGPRGWLLGVLMAAVLLATFVALNLYNAPSTAAEQKPAASPEAAPAALPVAVSTPVPPPAASYPLAKEIEVTGFRFVGDTKPEVRYLVVNHSGAGLGNVTVYVTLHSSGAKSGEPALYRFSFRAPTLGPFESKEMSVAPDRALDRLARSTADWQSLRADIELGQ